MANKIGNIEFKEPPTRNKAYSYTDIAIQTSYSSLLTYHLDTTRGNDSLLQGKGISLMQYKIALVLKTYHRYVYDSFFVDDVDVLKQVTSGIYGPKTMGLVLKFQDLYMDGHFEDSDNDPLKGYGSFGGHTKYKLDRMYKSATITIAEHKREAKYSNRKEDPPGDVGWYSRKRRY